MWRCIYAVGGRGKGAKTGAKEMSIEKGRGEE